MLLKDGEEVGDFPAQRLRCALLVHLCVERSASREQLVSMLWPDRDGDRARHALSQTLYEIRRDLGADVVDSQGERIAADAIAIDAVEFEAAVERGETDEAVALYSGPFLSDFHLHDNAAFEHWVDRQRARYQRLYRRIQRAHVGELASSGDVAGALAAARAWTAVEPLEDEANHRLIELLAATGERSAALRHYELYVDHLRGELDVQPLEQTKALVAHIRETVADSPRLRPLALSDADDTTVEPGTAHPPSTVAEPGEGGVAVATDAAPTDAADVPPSNRPGERWPRRSKAMGVAIAAAVVVLAAGLYFSNASPCAAGGPPPCIEPTPGRSHVLVLPLHGETDGPVDGFLAARLLARSLDSWRDVGSVDFLRVQDALDRAGLESPIGLEDGDRLARVLGADRLVMGEIATVGDSVLISATLYPIDGDGMSRTARMTLNRAAPEVSRFDSAVAYLLLGDDAALVANRVAEPGPSLRALAAFRTGEEALSEWDLREAGRHYATAARGDSMFALAYLRLAEVLAWAEDTSALWRDAAVRASLLADRLPDHEADLAHGFRALAERRYPDACASFREALSHDAVSFVAWYGLGDCNAWDPAVVRDSASPTGWAFRASQNAAIASYMRALELVPSFNFSFRNTAYARLTRLIRTEPNQPAFGTGPDGMTFAATPFLQGDTIAFRPIPFQSFATADEPAHAPGSWLAALERNRRGLRRIVETWAEAFPASAAALEAFALALERSGDIGAETNPSALDVAARAQALAEDESRRLRLGAMRVRLHVKRGEYGAAHALADSILSGQPEPLESSTTELVAGIAALVGRVREAARLWAGSARGEALVRSAEVGYTVPVDLAEALLRVQVYGAFDRLGDSTRTLWTRIERDVYDRGRLPDERDAHLRMLDIPASVAFRHVGTTRRHEASDFFVLQLQNALAGGDFGSARTVLEVDERFVGELSPADISPFATREKVSAHLAVGDTMRARQLLLDALRAVPAMQQDMWSPVDAAALVQMMLQHALLEAGRGDLAAARPWARAVAQLWATADAPLRTDVERATRILQSPRPSP